MTLRLAEYIWWPFSSVWGGKRRRKRSLNFSEAVEKLT